MGLLDKLREWYIGELSKEERDHPTDVALSSQEVNDSYASKEDSEPRVENIQPKPLTNLQKLMLKRAKLLDDEYDGMNVELAGQIRNPIYKKSKKGLSILTAQLFVTDDFCQNLVWFDKPDFLDGINQDSTYYVKGKYVYDWEYGSSIQNPSISDNSTLHSNEEFYSSSNWNGRDFYGKSASPGSKWSNLRDRVLNRDEHKCVRCGSMNNLQVDHKTPLKLGGKNIMSNLQTLCVDCHQLKHNREFDNDYDVADDYGENYTPSMKVRKIIKALDDNTEIRISYQNLKGENTTRNVLPIRLYEQKNRIYLEAYCNLRFEDRTFRVSRIKSISEIK